MPRLEENFGEFKDFNVSFEPHPITKDLMLVKNQKSVAQSITVLLSTFLGERIIEKDIGSEIRNFLFDIPNESSAEDLREEIVRTIRQHEPRVRSLNVRVIISDNQKTYNIEIRYFDYEVVRNEQFNFSDAELLRFTVSTN